VELVGDPASYLHQDAAVALGLIGSTKACPGLVAVLSGSTDRRCREAAAIALRLIRCKEALEVLLGKANDLNEDADVRGVVIEALANLAEFAPAVRRRVQGPLLQALEDGAPVVRFWACFALAVPRDQAALPVVRRLAEHDQAIVPGWWSVAGEARWAAAVIEGDPQAEQLEDANNATRIFSRHPPESPRR